MQPSLPAKIGPFPDLTDYIVWSLTMCKINLFNLILIEVKADEQMLSYSCVNVGFSCLTVLEFDHQGEPTDT